MAETLDIYDESGAGIGTAERGEAHTKGLWHKTVHLWLAGGGKVVFQRRAASLDNNPGKLYTTASGHLLAGETSEDALARESREELGIEVSSPVFLYETKFSADFLKTDGSEFHDRVFAQIYVAKSPENLVDFSLQRAELDGVVRFEISDCLKLFSGEVGQIKGEGFLWNGEKFEISEGVFGKDDFLLNKGETLEGKYGVVLRTIMRNENEMEING